MSLRKSNQTGSLTNKPDAVSQTQRCGGVLALLEIAVATTIVVGLFSAVSQPFGWHSSAQFLLCASLAGLLWFADARRDADELAAGSNQAAYRCPGPAIHD